MKSGFVAAFCWVAMLALTAGARAGDDPLPRYSLKQETPHIGTNIKRDLVSGSLLPYDKRYSELSADERAILNSWYENIGPNDEPPFPALGLGPIYRAIGEAQRKLLVNGEMVLAVTVDGEGKPTSVEALKSADAKMTKVAATVLMLTSYKPALCDGKPCVMQFPVRITFGTFR